MEEQKGPNIVDVLFDKLQNVKSEKDAKELFNLYIEMLSLTVSSITTREDIAKKGLVAFMSLYNEVDRRTLMRHFLPIFEPIASDKITAFFSS